jgi:hypothetical protein
VKQYIEGHIEKEDEFKVVVDFKSNIYPPWVGRLAASFCRNEHLQCLPQATGFSPLVTLTLKKGDSLGLLLDVPNPFKEEHKSDLSFLNTKLIEK